MGCMGERLPLQIEHKCSYPQVQSGHVRTWHIGTIQKDPRPMLVNTLVVCIWQETYMGGTFAAIRHVYTSIIVIYTALWMHGWGLMGGTVVKAGMVPVLQYKGYIIQTTHAFTCCDSSLFLWSRRKKIQCSCWKGISHNPIHRYQIKYNILCFPSIIGVSYEHKCV